MEGVVASVAITIGIIFAVIAVCVVGGIIISVICKSWSH